MESGYIPALLAWYPGSEVDDKDVIEVRELSTGQSLPLHSVVKLDIGVSEVCVPAPYVRCYVASKSAGRTGKVIIDVAHVRFNRGIRWRTFHVVAAPAVMIVFPKLLRNPVSDKVPALNCAACMSTAISANIKSR
jgi:hypothetical protein